MKIPRDIKVELTFLRPEHGGRSKPACSGYRPQFHYRGRDWDARHEYIGSDQVEPGETSDAFLGFLSPQEHLGNIYPGMAFLIREGNRTVGYGAVKEIVDLERSANKNQSTPNE